MTGDTVGQKQSPTPELQSKETEIYYPSFLAHGSKINVRGLSASDHYDYDEARQTLYITVDDARPGKVYDISISLSPRLRAVFSINDIL